MTPVGFCEIDPFCRDVLRRHWPDVPILHDVRTTEFPNADVICGGFPCTDVSRAGKRAGITGPDSGLYRELVRAIRVVRPKVAILENVAALLGDGMGDVLGDLAEGGDCRWIEYDCVPAVAVGAPHERDRVWIVAHTAEERSQGTQLQRRNSGIDTRSGNEVSNRAASNASHPECLQSLERYIAQSERGWQNKTEQTRLGVGGNAQPTNPESDRCGQGRTGRPPDSFARIRDEARRNSADPYGARLAFREGIGRDAWEELTTAQRSRGEDVGQSIWPDEPALSGVDDAIADWMDRTKATGNTLDPFIPELIALAILDQQQ
jgi:DNA (cytosine-5)-methyltransferase 1